MRNYQIPQDFIRRRLHSLAGLWLVLFLFEHLLTNSQSALLLGDDGAGFIRSVNFIHRLPYLPLIELGLIAVPFLLHGLWGIRYAWEGRTNSVKRGEASPYMPYSRNRAFTWQRITSWVLLIGVVLHVVNMRFLHYPEETAVGLKQQYLVKVAYDEGLRTLGARLGFTVYDEKSIELRRGELSRQSTTEDPVQKMRNEEEVSFVETLLSNRVKAGEVVVVAPDFGTASLLAVRNTFKQPLMIVLYSLFVIAAAYHAGNGLWTAFITWGINLKLETQQKFLKLSNGFAIILGGLGLASVWLTYYNLSQ